MRLRDSVAWAPTSIASDTCQPNSISTPVRLLFGTFCRSAAPTSLSAPVGMSWSLYAMWYAVRPHA